MVRLFFSLIKWSLIAWGLLCLLLPIAIGGFFAWQFTLGNKPMIDFATPKDVRFILNDCNLGEQRLKKIIRSYKSKRSFTGDHLDAYELEITDVNPVELMPRKDSNHQWFSGDKLPEYLNDAVKFASAWSEFDKLKWFPAENTLRSPQVYACPKRILYHGTKVSAVELIFIKPSDKAIFYIDIKI